MPIFLSHVSLATDGPLAPSRSPWLMEIGGWVVFAAVAVGLGMRWARDRRPPLAALLFIGCFSMFWQEFFADWGAYLYWNPDLILLPWEGPSFTTPNKPLYVLAGYGWFYAGFFPAAIWCFRRFRAAKPEVPYLAALVIVVLVPFYLWNLFTADAISFVTNWYQYLHVIGPHVESSKGDLPLLYPALPFALFAPAVVASLDRRDAQGRTWFERLLRVRPDIKNGRERLHQVLAWVVGMNLMYATFLTIPLVLIRVLFLPDNAYVPHP